MRRRTKRMVQGQWDELVQETTKQIPSVSCILKLALQDLQLDDKFIYSQFGELLR